MAKYSVSSGRRGRPLSIDPQAELDKLVFQTLPKAQERLTQFRKQTSGVRDVSLLGSETQLPGYIEASIDILQDLREGASISYETLKELKNNLRCVEQLASRQERVFGRSLDTALTSDYFQSLDYFSRNSSEFVKQSNEKVKARLRSMSPQQRQKAFFSAGYQDPATMTGRSPSDERIRAWARKHSGNNEMTYDEAWAYLREQRWLDSSSTSF